MLRRWAAACVVAQAVSIAAWLVAAAWQVDDYSVTKHTISDMYAVDAPHGAWLAAALTVCGVATIGFALFCVPRAFRRAGRRAWVSAALLAACILGLGDALSFLEREKCQLATPGCTMDEQLKAGGAADSVLSSVGLLLLVAAGFVLAGAMRRTPGWESFAGRARAFSVVLIVLLILTVAAESVDLAGLLERILAAYAAAGMGALAVQVRREAPADA